MSENVTSSSSGEQETVGCSDCRRRREQQVCSESFPAKYIESEKRCKRGVIIVVVRQDRKPVNCFVGIEKKL